MTQETQLSLDSCYSELLCTVKTKSDDKEALLDIIMAKYKDYNTRLSQDEEDRVRSIVKSKLNHMIYCKLYGLIRLKVLCGHKSERVLLRLRAEFTGLKNIIPLHYKSVLSRRPSFALLQCVCRRKTIIITGEKHRPEFTCSVTHLKNLLKILESIEWISFYSPPLGGHGRNQDVFIEDEFYHQLKRYIRGDLAAGHNTR